MFKKWFVALRIMLVLFVTLIIGCDDFFEEDISNAIIEVYAPKEEIVISDTTVTFFWNSISKADVYHIQVFNPSFDQINSMPIDSIVSVTSIKFILENGSYEWRIRAENGYYQTDYFYNTFSVSLN